MKEAKGDSSQGGTERVRLLLVEIRTPPAADGPGKKGSGCQGEEQQQPGRGTFTLNESH